MIIEYGYFKNIMFFYVLYVKIEKFFKWNIK